MRRIIAAPATPPTMPPTRIGVGGALLPPEPPSKLDVGEGPVAVAVLPMPTTPPVPGPVLEAATDDGEVNTDWVGRCDDADADEARVVGVEVICVEDNSDLRAWLFRVEVSNPLRLDVPEVEVTGESTLDKEACEVADCRGIELVTPLDPELRLLRLEDADDAADAVTVELSALVAKGHVSKCHVKRFLTILRDTVELSLVCSWELYVVGTSEGLGVFVVCDEAELGTDAGEEEK